MRTRKTTPADIPALKAIWNEAFAEDSRQDIDEFFETLYPNATGFCAEDETGRVCAMLFALPQTIVKGEKQLKAAYLYAVATKKESRGRGYCRAVMAYAEKELRKRYVEALLLSPATQDLADFYARLGFSRQTGGSKQILDCAEAKGQATEIGVPGLRGASRDGALGYFTCALRQGTAGVRGIGREILLPDGGLQHGLRSGESRRCRHAGVRLRAAAPTGRF